MRGTRICLVLGCLLSLAACRAAPQPPQRSPAETRFQNTAFTWSVQPPADWRPTATGGNADPATAPAVTFVPPGPGRSQDEYLAVRLCRTAAECVPPGASPVDAAGGSGAYAVERRPAPGRRIREVHTLVVTGGRTFDLMLSRPGTGGQAEAFYPAFRNSFRAQG